MKYSVPRMCLKTFVRKGSSLGNYRMALKQHEVRMLTTNLIPTASGVYQHSTAAAFRYLGRFWKTFLCPSQVVTCTQVTVGMPHLARLEYRYRNNQGTKVRDINIFL